MRYLHEHHWAFLIWCPATPSSPACASAPGVKRVSIMILKRKRSNESKKRTISYISYIYIYSGTWRQTQLRASLLKRRHCRISVIFQKLFFCWLQLHSRRSSLAHQRDLHPFMSKNQSQKINEDVIA